MLQRKGEDETMITYIYWRDTGRERGKHGMEEDEKGNYVLCVPIRQDKCHEYLNFWMKDVYETSANLGVKETHLSKFYYIDRFLWKSGQGSWGSHVSQIAT